MVDVDAFALENMYELNYEINEEENVALVNIGASFLLFLFVFTGKGRKIGRWEGIVFVLIYAVYLTLLILNIF